MSKKNDEAFENLKTSFDDAFYKNAKTSFVAQIDKLESGKGTLVYNFSTFFNEFEKSLDKKHPKVMVDRFMLDLIFRIFDLREIVKVITQELVSENKIFSGHERYEEDGKDLMLYLEVVPLQKKRYDS